MAVLTPKSGVLIFEYMASKSLYSIKFYAKNRLLFIYFSSIIIFWIGPEDLYENYLHLKKEVI